MKKGLFSVLALLLVVTLLAGIVTGCSNSTTAASKEATVTIGVDTPLSGGAAPWGLSEMHGVTLAADDFNAAGGLTVGDTHYTIKVEALDDAYDTAKTTNNIRQMVYTDGIKFMFTFQTEGSLALAPTLTQQKVLNFTVVNDDNIIKQPGNSYTYRTYMGFSVQANDYVKWMAKTYPQAKSLAVLTTNDTNGNVTEGYAKKAAAAAGLTYLAPVLYDAGSTKDFTPFVTKIMAEKPDIILTIGDPTGDVGLIAKTLYGLGYKGIHATGIVGAADLLPIAGQDAIEGMLTLNLPLIPPQVSSAVLGLPAREDSTWNAHYCCTWDFYSEAMIMFDAMKQAKSVDPTVVKAKLDQAGAKFVYAALNGGTATFGSAASNAVFGTDGGHQVTNSWAITIVKGGKDTIGAVISP